MVRHVAKNLVNKKITILVDLYKFENKFDEKIIFYKNLLRKENEEKFSWLVTQN